MQKGGSVYIMSSPNRASLYVGVTSNLRKRVWEHKNKVNPTGFTSKYNCVTLVYHTGFYSIQEAISEEKRLKAGSRRQKEKLIDSMNPEWRDLWEDIEGW